ncbi:MAG: hypothetical protein AAF741_00325 [Bacteroidota bacterium]
MQHLFVFFISVCSICLSCSADTEGGVDVRITGKESNFIDSIMQAESPSLREQLDSLCEIRQQSAVLAATDSIVQERLEEEARLKARRPLNSISRGQ